MDQLKLDRQALADRAYNTYSPSNYPGSKAWRANMAAEAALEAFDAAHPEVIAAIKAARDAKPLSDAAARALRGED